MPRIRAYRLSCDQCELLSICGVPCHERGCPNTNARFDRDLDRWVKQYDCDECGQTLDVGDPCCGFDDEEIEVEYDAG